MSWPWGNPSSLPPTLGSVVLKLAWRVLDPAAGDDLERFVHLPALLKHEDGTQESVEVGLVGLHIAHKTLSAMTWVWATFEQVDNLPLEPDPPDTSSRYTFYNPKCSDCPVNTPTDAGVPTQLVRELPIEEVTQEINDAAQTRLTALNTVLQFYRLVGAQWPKNPELAASLSLPCIASEHSPVPSGNPQPALLTNPVLESFNQKESCMDCHASASIASGRAATPGGALFDRPGSADFLFLFTHVP